MVMYVLSIGFRALIIGMPLKFNAGRFLLCCKSRYFLENELLFEGWRMYLEILLLDFCDKVSNLADLFKDSFISEFDLKNLAVFFGAY